MVNNIGFEYMEMKMEAKFGLNIQNCYVQLEFSSSSSSFLGLPEEYSVIVIWFGLYYLINLINLVLYL